MRVHMQHPQVLADTAPGVKPGGEVRRQEWCCGPVQHFDISYWCVRVCSAVECWGMTRVLGHHDVLGADFRWIYAIDVVGLSPGTTQPRHNHLATHAGRLRRWHTL
jgi:hypothetical protein